MKNDYNSFNKSIVIKTIATFFEHCFPGSSPKLIELAGPQLFTRKDSLTNLFLKKYLNTKVLAVEKNKIHFQTLKRTKNDNRVKLFRGSLKKSFYKVKEPNFIFADYCRGWNSEIQNDFKHLALSNIVKNKCLLAITLNVNEGRAKRRIARSKALDYYKIKRVIQKEMGYKYRIKIIGYSCSYKQHTFSDDMVVHLFLIKRIYP